MRQIPVLICLVLVASTAAYGLQLTAAALLPAAASADQLASAAGTRNVLIIAVDPVTGDRAQLECHAPSSAFASDVLLVDASDFLVVSQRCSPPSTSGVRR
jgi:hypothetical protein